MVRNPGRRRTLAETQKRFAAHIRDPAHERAPGDVEDRRMAIYRELFYNNIEGFLANNFPVIRTIYNDLGWHALVRDFFVEHRARTPLFPELPREFLHYLQDVRGRRTNDPAFLLELAHYEWVELALSLDDSDPDAASFDPHGDLLQGKPVLSPLAWLLTYQFPVHRIRPDYQPVKPPDEPAHLLAYRDRDDRVCFMELNPVSARLVALLKEDSDSTGLECIEGIAAELKHPDPPKVIAAGHAVLLDLQKRGVILGTQ